MSMKPHDPSTRQGSLFASTAEPQRRMKNGEQSLPTASSTAAVKTTTGLFRKGRSAADTMRAYWNSSSDEDSEASLKNLGHGSSARSRAASAAKSPAPPQLGYIDRQQTKPVASSSTFNSKASTSKPSTASKQQTTRCHPSVQSSSTSSLKNDASPYSKPASSNSKGKGRADNQVDQPRRKAPVIPDSSDEEEVQLTQEKAKKKKKTSSQDRIKRVDNSEGKRTDRRADVDVCPPEAPRPMHVDEFLFTPPSAQKAPSPAPPVSFTSTSSKENRNGHRSEHNTNRKGSAPAPTNRLPGTTTSPYRNKPERHDNSTAKSKNRYRNEDDLDYQPGIASSTTSDTASASSTASLQQATSRTKIASPVKRTPKAQPTLKSTTRPGNHPQKDSEPVYAERSPTVSKATKSGPSATKKMEDPIVTAKKPSKSDRDYMPSGNSGPARNSSPPKRPVSSSRRARPAVNGDGVSTSTPAEWMQRETVPSSSSSSYLASQRNLTDRRPPLADKEVRSSQTKKNKVSSSTVEPSNDRRNKTKVTDLTASSPEKSRPITLSSQRHADIDEDEEDSFVVADSSTIRKPISSTTGLPSSSKGPVSSLSLQNVYSGSASRGGPSPVYTSTKREKATSSARRAKPSAPAPGPSKCIQPMNLETLEISGKPSQFNTPRGSPSKRTVEVVVHTSPLSSKKRSDRPESNLHPDTDRKIKRRSVEKEIQSRLQRSDSPPEQTQILWRKAAASDSFDFDLDAKMEESDSDSDGDVPLADYKETVLCPFCDRPLPARPSKYLLGQLEQLCKRIDLLPRSSSLNEAALQLPATDTALTCKRHRDESEIIPKGEAAGYPTLSTIKWKGVKKRIKRGIIQDLMQIMNGHTQSSFHDSAIREWQKAGPRKMGNIRNVFFSFYLELPGYYGQKGFEVIMETLTKELVSTGVLTTQHSAPLDVEVYLRRVLVPETAARLIQADQKCSFSKALTILEESRDYGAAVFGDSETTTSLQESQYERGQRYKEERAEASQREDLLSSQGPEATALRRGQAVIDRLRKVYE